MTTILDEIVNLTITRDSQGLTTQGFGIPMILGESMKLDRRLKSYANITEVAEDFAITDVEYKMASIAFSQTITVQRLTIGKKVSTPLASPIVAATQILTTTANFEITAHNLELGATITTVGFTPADYNGSFIVTEITDVNNVKVELLTDPAGDAAIVGTYGASETWGEAIQSVFDYDSSWYALAITSNAQADIKDSAAKIETLGRIFFARTSDLDNLDKVIATSVMAELKALNYSRTLTTFNTDSTNKYIDIAWLARRLPSDPGSPNWAYLTLVGVVADSLKSSEADSVLNTNNGNTYQNISGKDATRYGKVANGDWIDLVRGSDWLKVRIQERIFLEEARLSELNSKIPYTDEGAAIIENLIREILDLGVTSGFIAPKQDGTGDYTITTPLIADVPPQDRINRNYPGVKFAARMAGAMNTFVIEGELKI